MKTLMILVSMVFVCSYAWAYPEFQRYSKEVSGRPINCAICHTHSDGPEGLKPGQIGSLDNEQNNALGLARQAFKPGNTAKSPILNDFGNKILNDLGKEKLTELRNNPQLLAPALSKISDMDKDGIPDAEEFLDGTHPLNSLDGHPWKLFVNNLLKNRFHIIMMVLATACGLFGLYNALLWLGVKASRRK